MQDKLVLYAFNDELFKIWSIIPFNHQSLTIGVKYNRKTMLFDLFTAETATAMKHTFQHRATPMRNSSSNEVYWLLATNFKGALPPPTGL